MTALAAGRPGVVPVVRHLDAVARVLVLQVKPGSVPAGVDLLIGAQLGQAGLAADLDTVRSPASVLRILVGDLRALEGYDAVVAITGSRTRHGRTGGALERAVAQLATRLPTLLVHVRPARHLTDRPADGAAGLGRLVLPSGVQARSAARQIGRALLGLIGDGSAGREAAAVRATTRRLQQVARLARDAFEMDAAELNLVEDGVLTTLATAGSDMRTGPSAGTLCEVALERPGITVMPDTWLDPEGCRTIAATRRHAVRFYAAVPVHDAAGRLVGTLCVYDSRPHAGAGLDFGLLHDLALLGEGELVEAEQRVLAAA